MLCQSKAFCKWTMFLLAYNYELAQAYKTRLGILPWRKTFKFFDNSVRIVCGTILCSNFFCCFVFKIPSSFQIKFRDDQVEQLISQAILTPKFSPIHFLKSFGKKTIFCRKNFVVTTREFFDDCCRLRRRRRRCRCRRRSVTRLGYF